jgi:hypothetical protein
MPTAADRALENVHNLYLMQFQLLDLLESDLRNPTLRKQVRTQMKQFEELLTKADWRYMGGLDVWEELQKIPEEMSRKLRESAMVQSTAVRVSRKTTRAKATAKRRK